MLCFGTDSGTAEKWRKNEDSVLEGTVVDQ